MDKLEGLLAAANEEDAELKQQVERQAIILSALIEVLDQQGTLDRDKFGRAVKKFTFLRDQITWVWPISRED